MQTEPKRQRPLFAYGIIAVLILLGGIVFATCRADDAEAQPPPETDPRYLAHYMTVDGGYLDVASGECTWSPYEGWLCVAPPQTSPCSPYCPAPGWQPPLPGSVTLCRVDGYCQRYIDGYPVGDPWLSWGPSWPSDMPPACSYGMC